MILKRTTKKHEIFLEVTDYTTTNNFCVENQGRNPFIHSNKLGASLPFGIEFLFITFTKMKIF